MRDNRIEIIFPSLVIKKSSLGSKVTDLPNWFESKKLRYKNNRELVVLSEMISPPSTLLKFTEEELEVLGLNEVEDYIFIEPELFSGVERPGVIYKPRKPKWTERVNWLDGIVSEEGNFIWIID